MKKLYVHSLNYALDKVFIMSILTLGFPGGSNSKESDCNADLCSIPKEAKRLAQASRWERLLSLEGLQQRHVLVVTHHRGRNTRSNSLGM